MSKVPDWTRRRKDLEDEATQFLKQASLNQRAEKRAKRRASMAQSRQDARALKEEANKILRAARKSKEDPNTSTRKRRSGFQVSLNYIIAKAYQALAIQECKSSTVQQVLRKIRMPARGAHWFQSLLFRRKGAISITIPHYWAKFYHDGYRGGPYRGKRRWIKKRDPRLRWAGSHRGYWLAVLDEFTGKCNGIDPRRPARAIDEVRLKDYKANVFRNLPPSKWREVVRRIGKNMLWMRHRKGWPGDKFLDRAKARLNTFLEKEIAMKAVPALLSSTVDGSIGRVFGRRVRASLRRVRLRDFRDPQAVLGIKVTYNRVRTMTNIEDVGGLGASPGLDFDAMG